jgi:formylglycine-generating enzyme required for sulfatase activity
MWRVSSNLGLVGLVLVLGSSASSLTMDWTFVGNPGNSCDGQTQGCFGAVDYVYGVATHEVTNVQYAEFLNAKAAADPLSLYNTSMGSGLGGITRTGVSGSYNYTAITGRENMPVNYVSFYDALRFANWLHNGQGSGDTETGAYTLLGGTAAPTNGLTVTRNAGATIVLASEDEWYKAAYYDGVLGVYYDFPAGVDATTTCAPPGPTPNTANCDYGSFPYSLADVGSYTGSPSPYGTFDQGGNLWEWNETISGTMRIRRGGSYGGSANSLAASFRSDLGPSSEVASVGFRVALVPEPGTGVLVLTGLTMIAARRSVRGQRANARR